jgi:hypothetical protein
MTPDVVTFHIRQQCKLVSQRPCVRQAQVMSMQTGGSGCEVIPTIDMVATKKLPSGKCSSGVHPDAKKGLFHVKQTLL